MGNWWRPMGAHTANMLAKFHRQMAGCWFSISPNSLIALLASRLQFVIYKACKLSNGRSPGRSVWLPKGARPRSNIHQIQEIPFNKFNKCSIRSIRRTSSPDLDLVHFHHFSETTLPDSTIRRKLT